MRDKPVQHINHRGDVKERERNHIKSELNFFLLNVTKQMAKRKTHMKCRTAHQRQQHRATFIRNEGCGIVTLVVR